MPAFGTRGGAPRSRQRTTACPTCGASVGRACVRIEKPGALEAALESGASVPPHASRRRLERAAQAGSPKAMWDAIANGKPYTLVPFSTLRAGDQVLSPKYGQVEVSSTGVTATDHDHGLVHWVVPEGLGSAWTESHPNATMIPLVSHAPGTTDGEPS